MKGNSNITRKDAKSKCKISICSVANLHGGHTGHECQSNVGFQFISSAICTLHWFAFRCSQKDIAGLQGATCCWRVFYTPPERELKTELAITSGYLTSTMKSQSGSWQAAKAYFWLFYDTFAKSEICWRTVAPIIPDHLWFLCEFDTRGMTLYIVLKAQCWLILTVFFSFAHSNY